MFLVLLHGFLLQDVAYKPQEFYVKTRKCGRDAKADVVQICERQVQFLIGFLLNNYLSNQPFILVMFVTIGYVFVLRTV